MSKASYEREEGSSMEKTYNVSDAAEKLGVSVKTLQRWDRDGKFVANRTPSNRRYYTEGQITEAMNRNFDEARYFVVENRNVRSIDKPEFVETILFSGTKAECAAYEDAKRNDYKDRTVVDCFIQSETERNQIMLVNDFWNTLTEEEKSETITVNGKKYNKALYDFCNGKK